MYSAKYLCGLTVVLLLALGCSGGTETPPREENGGEVESATADQARGLLEKKDYEGAKKAARDVLVGDSSNLDAQLILLVADIYLDNLADAQKTMNRLNEVHPDESRVITAGALLSSSKGDLESAVRQLENGLSKHKDDVHIHHLLATLLVRTGKKLDAAEHFTRVRDIDPSYDGIPVSGGFEEFIETVEKFKGPIIAILTAIVHFIAAMGGSG